MFRLVMMLVLVAGSASAQLPRGFYAWWSSPVANDLNLTAEQQRKIRETVREYRPHLADIRTAVDAAEQDLADQFAADPVNPERANRSIERLIAARAELTRTLSQLSLRLRTVLTAQQWEELQTRGPDGKRRLGKPEGR